jgi:dUTP pyrophosphatase
LIQCKIKYHDPKCPKIEKFEQGDWLDLRVVDIIPKKTEDGIKTVDMDGKRCWKYSMGDFLLLNMGVSIEPPLGHEAHLLPRSSAFKNWSFLQTNSSGVIDESYSGNNDIWFMPVVCCEDGMIEQYSRVAQFRFVKKMEKLHIVEVDNLDNKDRGGHGSTGIK